MNLDNFLNRYHNTNDMYGLFYNGKLLKVSSKHFYKRKGDLLNRFNEVLGYSKYLNDKELNDNIDSIKAMGVTNIAKYLEDIGMIEVRKISDGI